MILDPSLADRILLLHLDPEDIWLDVVALPESRAPVLIACCEVAFARIAIIKAILRRSQPRLSRGKLFQVLDLMVDTEFGSAASAGNRLYDRPLLEVAHDAVALYYRNSDVPELFVSCLLERVQAAPDAASPYVNVLHRFSEQVHASFFDQL